MWDDLFLKKKNCNSAECVMMKNFELGRKIEICKNVRWDCFIKKKETEMKQFRDEMKLSDAYPSNKVSDSRDTRGFNYAQCYM